MKLKKEKMINSLVGTSVEGKHMVFPHIHETFYLAGMQHNDIKPSGAASLEGFEKFQSMPLKDKCERGGCYNHGVSNVRNGTEKLDYHKYAYHFLTFIVINLEKLLPLSNGK